MAEAQNIPVGSTTAGSIAVAAESTVATRMSAPPSFDVADFPSRTVARRSGASPRWSGCAGCTTAPPSRTAAA